MSRKHNIRWQQSDSEDLRKAVKNFNAKISRLEKKNPEQKNALPERVSVRQMKELIDTRQDLKRELNSLRRFTERGSEELVDVPDNDYNLKITKWQKKEMKLMESVANRKRAQRRERISDIDMTSRGEELGYKKGQIGMGKAEQVALDPIKAFTPSMNRRDLEKKYRKLRKESQSTYWDKRDEIMRSNYIKSLTDNFNPEDISDIIEKIEDMDFEEFLKVFEAEDLSSFELNYPPDSVQYQKYLSGLRAIWIPNK